MMVVSEDEENPAMGDGRSGLDAALDAIGHRHRRRLLDHLANVDETIDLTEAARTIAASDEKTVDELRFDLHHRHLPKLTAIGLVEYDTVDETLHYRADARVEALLETIEACW